MSTIAEVLLPTSFRSEVIREVAADAPQILGIGIETATGIALGGGGVAAAVGGYKLLKTLLRKDRDPTAAGGPSIDPFPRSLDEAVQHQQIRRHTERRSPEYDAAVGRVVETELQTRLGAASEEERKTLRAFWDGCRDRVDRLMPPSVREYL